MDFEGLTKQLLDSLPKKEQKPPTADETQRNADLLKECVKHNPYTKKHFNLTKQMELAKAAKYMAQKLEAVACWENSPEYMAKLAEAVGTELIGG